MKKLSAILWLGLFTSASAMATTYSCGSEHSVDISNGVLLNGQPMNISGGGEHTNIYTLGAYTLTLEYFMNDDDPVITKVTLSENGISIVCQKLSGP